MKIPPEPPVGHVIAYEYLWASQADSREDGRKTYPAAIILSQQNAGPAPITYALGISHTPPIPGRRALQVPPKLKRWLGLDTESSWIYTDEINIFVWPGPDLCPADRLSHLPQAKGTCVIGPLPDDWFRTVLDHVAESYELQKMHAVKRSE